MLPGGDYKETAQKAIELVEKGFNPVPHFPARSMKDEKALKDINEMINMNVDRKRSFLSRFHTQRVTSFFKYILSCVSNLRLNRKPTERVCDASFLN